MPFLRTYKAHGPTSPEIGPSKFVTLVVWYLMPRI